MCTSCSQFAVEKAKLQGTPRLKSKTHHACVPSRPAGCRHSSRRHLRFCQHRNIAPAEGNNGAVTRFLRAEKISKEEKKESEEDEEAEEEERVLPGTDLAAKLAPKLEKALSNKQLAKTTMDKERWQFALWFIQGKGPSYVAANILKVNPLSSTGKAVAMYHRYVQYFQKYKFTGIRSHFNTKY
ncbi:hypothetical protein PHYSODRAFT_294708 [Phytophthora sojae]|uniref:RxLR effector protein n=1 Tax=Phytophthora sojae (strain P6497) TaxID=1094619 RepID=G4YHT8_PHYSP|nr:hypothetical protein PHYSODRAFT_294708 [Phytophthora sojae]EGZ29665.1 hypothetical protein PHYSODRAFT_294708 [Phytophthora sojae]|eukprot:XP_009516940.1 hypothetical protein PHYSODRAFT_294708 [Phytophthora sojae]